MSLTAQDATGKIVAPAYFGPNAFPLPPMRDARVPRKVSLTTAAEAFVGRDGSLTLNPYYYCSFPFAPGRVSVNVWGAIYEWWQDSDGVWDSGDVGGDIYISTDIQMCSDKKYLPEVLLRIGIKTASGADYSKNRFYDSAGYFFDTFVGKSLYLKGAYFGELRATANVGFLCWQMADAKQNDALMYGLMLRAAGRDIDIDAQVGGYSGWREDGDRLLFAALTATAKLKRCRLFVDYGLGIRDYPYSRFRVGVTVPIAEMFVGRK